MSGSQKEGSTMSEQEKPASDGRGEIAHWGQQTIFFAMGLRAMDVEKPIDARERIKAAGVEASHITQELWDKAYNAVAENHDPVRVEHVTMPFARQVLDWVADHLGSSTG